MAILSNINGKFAVESSGAIQLSGSAGTSGYVLKSNGTGNAASWVDPTTIIGGPYLPLSGGTLTGATATASNIAFTVGGTFTVTGKFQTTSTGAQVTGSTFTVYHPSSATKLQFIQTNGNWKIEAGGGTNKLVFHSESLVEDYLTIKGGGQIQLNDYGSGSHTGTTAYTLAVDSSGNIIETTDGGGDITGSGTTNTVAKFTGAKAIGDGPVTFSGNDSTFAGNVNTTSGNLSIDGTGFFASTLTVRTANSNILTLDRTTSAGGYMRFQNNGTDKFYIGSRGTISGSGGTGYDLYAVSGNDIRFFPGTLLALTLDTSANATFAGTIDVASTIYTAESLRFDGAGLNATDKKLYSPTDGELQWFTHNLAGAKAFSVSHQGTRQVYLNVSGNSYLNGGNVGIGNTNPGAKLTVGSNTHGNATGIEVSAGSGGGNVIGIDGANNHNWFPYTDGNNYYSADNHTFRGGTNNTPNYMVINSSGYVGIGTTSPSVPLHVYSAAPPGGVGFKTQSGNASNWIQNTSTAGSWQMGVTSSGWQLYNDDTSSIRLTVQNGGNVGINTASPSYKLDVSGVGAFGTGNYRTFVHGSGSGSFIEFGTNADNDALGVLGTFSSAMVFSTTQGLGFKWQYAGNDRMTLTTGGNLGIGTTGPDRKLDVSGTGNVYAKIQSTNSTAAGIELDTAGGSTENWLIQADESVDGLAIYDLGRTAYRMVIDDAGSVGIGTASPAQKLHVASGHIRIDSGYALLWDDSHERIEQSDGHLEFFINNGQAMTLDTNGLGIGTTSPSHKLHVSGTGGTRMSVTNTDTNWAAVQIQASGNQADYIFFKDDTEERARITALDTNDLIFSNTDSVTERMRIKSGGYIGMNTSPSGFATLEIENIASTTYGLYVDYTDTNGSYGAMKVILTGASTSPSYVDWWYGATQTGAVVTTGSSTQYLTSSDYRLKENIVPMSNAIDRVMQLKPSRFNFIGHENTVDGLIAHEVAEVVPEAVNGKKDGLRDDGTPKYQGIDEGKLVPLLIGAIQELEARVKELENK